MFSVYSARLKLLVSSKEMGRNSSLSTVSKAQWLLSTKCYLSFGTYYSNGALNQMQGKQNDLMELLSLFNVYVRQQTILLSQTNYTIFFKVIFQNLSFHGYQQNISESFMSMISKSSPWKVFDDFVRNIFLVKVRVWKFRIFQVIFRKMNFSSVEQIQCRGYDSLKRM